MRGSDAMQESLFTVAKLDDVTPSDQPLRAVQVLVNEALGQLISLFNALPLHCSRTGSKRSMAVQAGKQAYEFPASALGRGPRLALHGQPTGAGAKQCFATSPAPSRQRQLFRQLFVPAP